MADVLKLVHCLSPSKLGWFYNQIVITLIVLVFVVLVILVIIVLIVRVFVTNVLVVNILIAIGFDIECMLPVMAVRGISCVLLST